MLTYKAFAKINWALSVLNKRNDGYHDIISLMHAIDLYDTLIFEPSSGIEIQTELPIKRENNLIYKAIIALQQYTGIKKGIKVTLQKQIPIGAGLGGGSSDAATTLKALNELWGLNLGVNTLQKIGVSIGSDVPFFFNLPLCIVEGRGDIIKPLKIEKSYTLVIVKPEFSISTKWAYEFLYLETELTTEYKKINNNIWQLYLLLCEGAYSNFHSWNDLEKSVSGKYPEIEKIKKKLLEAGALMSLLSGSGSTVFGVFNNEVDANETLKIFEGYWCKVVQTLTSY